MHACLFTDNYGDQYEDHDSTARTGEFVFSSISGVGHSQPGCVVWELVYYTF